MPLFSKSLLSSFCILLILFVISSKEVKASHAMGADIRYECLGGDSVLIELNFYRFCDGIPAPNSASVNINSPSGCGNTQNINLPKVDSISVRGEMLANGSDVTPLCEALAGQSSCGTGQFPGVEQYTYSRIVVLSNKCPDWTISYDLNARNAQITNLSSPGIRNLYVESVLNNTLGCNTSPEFTTSPVPYVCSGRLFNYNHGAIDIDGDSLVFTSINPLDNGQPIPYAPGFSPSNPLNTSTPFTVDQNTGQFSFTPIGLQFVVITILVEEFRNGVFIGSTMRDIQISIDPSYCSEKPLSNTTPNSNNVSGGVVTSPSSIEVCPGDSLVFQVNVVDTTAGQSNQLSLYSNAAQSMPGASFTINSSAQGDSLIGTFVWVPSGLDTGNNILIIESGDKSQCPIEAIEITSINIFVLPGTYAGPDLFYCPAGGPLQLNVVGGNSFTWSPAAGLSNPNIRNPLASPAQTQDYIVQSNLSSNCKNTDTIRINRVPDFILDVLPSGDTINVCRNGAQDIQVLTDAQWAPYTYNWIPASALNNANSNAVTALVDTSTSLYLSITSDTGCTIKDTIFLNVVGTGPKVNILADKEIICPGDTVNLDLELFPLACGAAIEGCGPNRPPVSIPFGTDTTAYTASPFSGSNNVGRAQLLYRAADLRAAGLSSGTIFRLAFDAKTILSGSGFGGVYENLTIKMGCTNEGNLNSRTWIPTNTVVWGPQDFNISQGTITFNLFQFQEYDWDGQSNIVIEFCYSNANGSAPGGNDQLATTSTSYPSMSRNYSNTSPNGCVLAPAFTYTELPNIIFTICAPSTSGYTYNWSPASSVSNPSISNPYIIVDDSVTYKVEVADSTCFGSSQRLIKPQSGYGIEIVPNDTFICNTGDTIQLNIRTTGNPPSTSLDCGANGTSCGNRPSKIHTVGNGVFSTDLISPYYGFWHDSRTQYIITAAELRQAGLSSGTINSIAFNVAVKYSTAPYNGFSIKMACTNLSELPLYDFVTTGFTTVYGPTSYSTVRGWNTHQLNNTFDWDGVSNIIIETCFNNSTYSSYDEVVYTSTSYGAALHDYADYSVGCNLTNPVNYLGKPVMRFNVCEAPPAYESVLWTPFTNISNDTIANPLVYPSVTTEYIVEYDFAKGCPVTDTVSIGVTNFEPIAPNDTSLCAGDSILLVFSGSGNKYTWVPDSTLSCSSCSSAYAFPKSNTTYRVLVQDSTTGCSEIMRVKVDVNQLPNIQIHSDSVLCFVDSIRLEAGANYPSYLWSTQETTSSILVNSPGLYFLTVVDSFSCSSTDSVLLKEGTTPNFSLIKDTSICEIDSFVLEGPIGNYSYYWNTGSTDTSYTAYVSGLYTLKVVDSIGCSFSDSTYLLLNESINLNLGNDTTICKGEKLVLNTSLSTRLYDFLWSDNSKDSFLTVSNSGIYSLTVTDTAGCRTFDTILVDVNNGPIVELRSDTTICTGGRVILNTGQNSNPSDDYLWSTNGIAPILVVTTEGLYSVTVTNAYSCSNSDSVYISIYGSQVSITGKTAICDGEPAILVASPGHDQYLWSPTQETTDSIIVTNTGQYSVTVTDTSLGCSAQASITVNNNSATPIDLGEDMMICKGDTITIGVFNPSYVSYSWSPNGDSLALVDVTEAGLYSVTVSDANGCTAEDEILISYFSDKELEIEDINTCSEFTTTVSIEGTYSSYQWSTGATTASITISEHGNYSVTVIDSFECTYTEVFTVNVTPFEVEASANPNQIESGEISNLVVSANGSGNYTFVWTSEPEDISLTEINVSSPSVSPSDQQTIYTVVVTDTSTGCIASDTTLIKSSSDYAFPNAFIPNGDNANNQYFNIIGNVTIKTFQIFNRWGEMVYNNDEPLLGWDGKFKGKSQPIGTYIYYVVILDASGEEIAPITGNVNLIR